MLVNCAGISPRGTVETTDEALWDRTLAINLKGAWLGIKAAMPQLRQRRGTIINIGSTRATRPMPGLFSYIVSKAGLWGLTQQVAVEYLARGDHVQHDRAGMGRHAQRAIDPGPVRPARFPRGDPQPHHARRNRRGRRLPGLVQGRKINGVILYLDAGLQIADDAGMVYLPDRSRPPYEQRIEGP